MYSVLQGASNSNSPENSSLGSRCEVHLLRSNKYFAKKPIQQLAVVPEHQILISLSGILVFSSFLTCSETISYLQITSCQFMTWQYLIFQS